MSIYSIGTAFWFALGAKYVLPILLFAANPAQATAVGSLISACLFLVILSLYLDRRRTRTAWPIGVKLVVVYVTWALITITYTSAHSKPIALAYWGVMAFDAASAALLMQMGRANRMAAACLRGIIAGSLLIAIVTVLLLRGSTDGRWGDEELLHPNTIGYQLTLASISALHLLFGDRNVERRMKLLFVLSLLVVTLLGTFSKTSILGFAFAAAVFLWRVRVKVTLKLAMLMLAPVALGLALLRLDDQIDHYMSAQMSGHALDTLTGRTLIWAQSLDMLLERPVLGYGYVAFRDVGPQIAQVRLVHAHNDFLNIWFNVGLVGLFVVILMYATTITSALRKRVYTHTAQDPSPFIASLTAFCLLRSITEGSVSNVVFPLHLMCLVHVWVFRLRSAGTEQRFRWRLVPENSAYGETVRGVEP